MNIHELHQRLQQRAQQRRERRNLRQQELNRESRLKTGHDVIVAKIAELFATPEVLEGLRLIEEEWFFVQEVFKNPHFMEANSLADLDLSAAERNNLGLETDEDNGRKQIWRMLSNWYSELQGGESFHTDYQGLMKTFLNAECLRMRRYLLHDTSKSRVALAPYADQFVTLDGHITSSELSERGTEVRVILTNVSVQAADKKLFYNHLNVYAPIALSGQLMQRLNQNGAFNGIVIKYHRSPESTDKSGQGFAYGVEKISFGRL